MARLFGRAPVGVYDPYAAKQPDGNIQLPVPEIEEGVPQPPPNKRPKRRATAQPQAQPTPAETTGYPVGEPIAGPERAPIQSTLEQTPGIDVLTGGAAQDRGVLTAAGTPTQGQVNLATAASEKIIRDPDTGEEVQVGKDLIDATTEAGKKFIKPKLELDNAEDFDKTLDVLQKDLNEVNRIHEQTEYTYNDPNFALNRSINIGSRNYLLDGIGSTHKHLSLNSDHSKSLIQNGHTDVDTQSRNFAGNVFMSAFQAVDQLRKQKSRDDRNALRSRAINEFGDLNDSEESFADFEETTVTEEEVPGLYQVKDEDEELKAIERMFGENLEKNLHGTQDFNEKGERIVRRTPTEQNSKQKSAANAELFEAVRAMGLLSVSTEPIVKGHDRAKKVFVPTVTAETGLKYLKEVLAARGNIEAVRSAPESAAEATKAPVIAGDPFSGISEARPSPKTSKWLSGVITLQEVASDLLSSIGYTVDWDMAEMGVAALTSVIQELGQKQKKLENEEQARDFGFTDEPINYVDFLSSDHPRANLFKLDKASVKSYLNKAKGDTKNVIKEINQRIVTLQKHSEFLSNIHKDQQTRVRYMLYNYSSIVGRLYQNSQDINFMNNKDLIRMGITLQEQHVTKAEALVDPVSTKAAAAFIYSEGKGNKPVGLLQQDRLAGMDSGTRSHIGGMYIFQHAAEALELIKPDKSDGYKGSDLASPGSVIEKFDQRTVDELANIWDLYNKNWKQGDYTVTDPKHESLIKKIFKRGEPQYYLSAMRDASVYKQRQEDGKPMKWTAQMELDSTQSNAFIIGMLTGNQGILDLLGAPVDAEYKTRLNGAMTNLRDRIWQNKAEAIQVLDADAKGDDQIRAAWMDFFIRLDALKDTDYDLFKEIHKSWGYDLVVAAGYGRTASRMYDEIEAFMSIDGVQQIAQEVFFDGEIYDYDDGGTKFYTDASTIYHANFINDVGIHEYQGVMKNVGEIVAATSGIKAMDGPFGEAFHFTREQFMDVADWEAIRKGDKLDPESVILGSGRTYTYKKSIQTVSGSKSTYLKPHIVKGPDGKWVTLYASVTPGSELRASMPVRAIQTFDAAILMASVFSVNAAIKKKNPKRNTPMPMSVIHDAMVATPDTILLANNAYNNIALPAVGKFSFWKNLNDMIEQNIDSSKKRVKKYGGAVIGTAGINKDFAGLTGIFDRMWFYQNYSEDSASEIEETRTKGKKISDYHKAVSPIFMKAAKQFGWLPPDPKKEDPDSPDYDANFVKERKFRRINESDFLNLLDLALISKGMKSKASDRSDDIKMIERELNAAVGFFSSNSKLRKMAEFSQKQKKAIGNITRENNQLTNSRPF